MAGDWIKFEIGTSDKPEVWAIAQQLNIDPDAVVGKLLRVWSWFDQHTENGNAAIVTKMLLDRVVGVTGFCNAVICCGWMEEGDGFIRLPNFDRHNGKTAKNRAVTAKRVASFKQNKRQGNDDHNDKGNDEVTPAPLPREEKRREDIKDITNSDELVSAPPKKQKRVTQKNLNAHTPDEELNFSSWPNWPSEQIWADYKKMRSAKRSWLTQTIVDHLGRVITELVKMGYTTDQVLTVATVGNWTGLEVHWVLKNYSVNTHVRSSAHGPPQRIGAGTLGFTPEDYQRGIAPDGSF